MKVLFVLIAWVILSMIEMFYQIWAAEHRDIANVIDAVFGFIVFAIIVFTIWRLYRYLMAAIDRR
jgi:hypothetical protein